MLNHSLHRLWDSVLLKFSGGDTLRADELRTRITGRLVSFILLTYLPLTLAVVVLYLHRPVPVDEIAQRDQETAVKAYAVRYVNTYLKDPADKAAIKEFFDGEMTTSALPPGGRATGPGSALPGVFINGFQTWSVLVDAEIPKAANSAAMEYIPLQVDISIDPRGLFRGFTLPHCRTNRLEGQPVVLATQTLVSEDRPIYSTVSGFLTAMFIGKGELAPYITAGSTLTAAQPPWYTKLLIELVQTNSEAANAQEIPPKADGIEVTVRAVLQTPSGVLMPMDFPLVMSVAGGHWQVDRINDAPSIIAPTDSGSPWSTPTTPTTTSTSSYAPNTPEGS